MAIDDRLLLSRYKLLTFLQCQRRFQLRYVAQIPWPSQPLGAASSAALARGDAFHRLVERYYLGLPVTLPPDVDATVARWWRTFIEEPPNLPAGERFPEIGMILPIAPIDGAGGHTLYGRYDLLVAASDQAHIFDWKSEQRPRSREALQADWQTRLYLTLLVEGGGAIGKRYRPEQVALTYWFVNDPGRTVTINYDREQHARNWAELRATVERIERRLAMPQSIWPLTDDLEQCAYCGYRTYCDRNVAPAALDLATAEMADEDGGLEIDQEPDLPGIVR